MSGLSLAMLQLDLCRTRSLCWIQPKLQGSWSAAWISCTTDSIDFFISTCVKLLPLPALFLRVFWACGTTFVAKSVQKAIAKIRRCKYQTATIATGNRGRVRHLFLKPVEFFPYARGSRNGKHIGILRLKRIRWRRDVFFGTCISFAGQKMQQSSKLMHTWHHFIDPVEGVTLRSAPLLSVRWWVSLKLYFYLNKTKEF